VRDKLERIGAITHTIQSQPYIPTQELIESHRFGEGDWSLYSHAR
jgi:hypothetical protein